MKNRKNKKLKTMGKAFIISALTLCSAGILSGCGEQGPKGDKGADGNIWIVQNSAPTNLTEGKSGDMFLDSSTFNLYKKVDYGWIFVGKVIFILVLYVKII